MLPGRKRDEGETGTTTAVARLGDRARKGAVLFYKLHRFVAARKLCYSHPGVSLLSVK